MVSSFRCNVAALAAVVAAADSAAADSAAAAAAAVAAAAAAGRREGGRDREIEKVRESHILPSTCPPPPPLPLFHLYRTAQRSV